MSKKCFIAAVKEELGGQTIIEGIPVFYSGVGKVNAAMAAVSVIFQGYKEIINIGSCGSKNHPLGEILKIGRVYQDIDATPLCEYGLTPFEEALPYILLDDKSDVSCFTTDYFYDEKQQNKYADRYLQMVNTSSVFDMELYAIAKACRKHEVRCTSYKWVSDDGNYDHWVDNCKASLDLLLHTIQL
jgi:adenosylhomocysteine nucleosidase